MPGYEGRTVCLQIAEKFTRGSAIIGMLCSGRARLSAANYNKLMFLEILLVARKRKTNKIKGSY